MALRDQLTLSLFDDTSLLGLTADVSTAAGWSILDPPTPEETPKLLPVDYQLAVTGLPSGEISRQRNSSPPRRLETRRGSMAEVKAINEKP